MKTLIITGAPSAAFVPGVLATLNQLMDLTSCNIILTHSAHSFVTRSALEAFSEASVIDDNFGAVDHQKIARESEQVFVYPATFNFVNKLSAGITDTLSLMVAQLTLKKLRLYVSLPEGLSGNSLYEQNRSNLLKAGVMFIEAETGLALSAKRTTPGGCPAPERLWHDLRNEE
ncbi:flavoprotein [Corynebacterium urogenitale]